MKRDTIFSFHIMDIGCQKAYLWQPWHIDFVLHPHKILMVSSNIASAFDCCQTWASVMITLGVMNLKNDCRYGTYIVRGKRNWRCVQSIKLHITEIRATSSVLKISASFKWDNKAIGMGFEISSHMCVGENANPIPHHQSRFYIKNEENVAITAKLRSS